VSTKPTYWEQLKSPQWQRRRLEIMSRDEFECQYCGDSESTLNVHHKHYFKGRMVWDYSDDELVTLCESCHELTHEEDGQWKMLLAKLSLDGPFSKSAAYTLIAGWAHLNCGEDLESEFGSSPLLFTIGQIAAALDRQDIETLIEAKDALQEAGPAVVREALRLMAAAIRNA
jgi:hypothetical protein